MNSAKNDLHKKPFLIGLTGGIATGKSTTSAYLSNFFPIIDSDLIVKDLYEQPQIKLKLEDLFQTSDKKQIGQIVTKDPIQRKKLEDLIHPFVYEEINRLIEFHHDQKVLILDIPLLFEVGYENKVDYTLLISCCKYIQVKRLMKRNNIDKSKAIELISMQKSLQEKRKLAHYVIHNNFSISSLKRKIDKFIKYIETILLYN